MSGRSPFDVSDATIDEVRRVREAGNEIDARADRVANLRHGIATRLPRREGWRVLFTVLGEEGEPDADGDNREVIAAGVIAILAGDVSEELAGKVDIALSEIGE